MFRVKAFKGNIVEIAKNSGIDFNGITCLLFCASFVVRTISKYLEAGALLHAAIVYKHVKCTVTRQAKLRISTEEYYDILQICC